MYPHSQTAFPYSRVVWNCICGAKYTLSFITGSQVDLHFPSHVSPEARDLISKVGVNVMSLQDLIM